MKPGWVYIMTNKPFGTLYIGVTAGASETASRGDRLLIFASNMG